MKVEYRYPMGAFWVTRARLGAAELLERQGRMEEALKFYSKLAQGEGQEAEDAKEKLKLHNRYDR